MASGDRGIWPGATVRMSIVDILYSCKSKHQYYSPKQAKESVSIFD